MSDVKANFNFLWGDLFWSYNLEKNNCQALFQSPKSSSDQVQFFFHKNTTIKRGLTKLKFYSKKSTKYCNWN